MVSKFVMRIFVITTFEITLWVQNFVSTNFVSMNFVSTNFVEAIIYCIAYIWMFEFTTNRIFENFMLPIFFKMVPTTGNLLQTPDG